MFKNSQKTLNLPPGLHPLCPQCQVVSDNYQQSTGIWRSARAKSGQVSRTCQASRCRSNRWKRQKWLRQRGAEDFPRQLHLLRQLHQLSSRHSEPRKMSLGVSGSITDACYQNCRTHPHRTITTLSDLKLTRHPQKILPLDSRCQSHL